MAFEFHGFPTMRLIQIDDHGELSLTRDLLDDLPPYAILSHTWGEDYEEVTFQEMVSGEGKSKVGYGKIRFCADQAIKDDLKHIWVDTCCIDKTNHTELSEAIISMFSWYQKAAKCYVFLSDVSTGSALHHCQAPIDTWEAEFRGSRWFTRGWTLQELIAPGIVEFFSTQGTFLGDKKSLQQQIHEITEIPVQALRGLSLHHFTITERFGWAQNRTTKRKEDNAYSLMGILDVIIPMLYGEGEEKASRRLREEVDKRYTERQSENDLNNSGNERWRKKNSHLHDSGTEEQDHAIDVVNRKNSKH